MTDQLVVDHASKWFGDLVAVSDISFTVDAGVTALLGPNGAGKSTLLRMLCGLTAPSQGSVRVLDRDPAPRPRSSTRQIGIVPQQEGIFERLTAREFVRLAGVLHEVDDPDGGRRARARRRRARPVRPAAPADLLEGHAPTRQGRAGARPRPAGAVPRRAAHRARPAPAAAHDRAVPTPRARRQVRPDLEPRARRGRALRLAGARDRAGPARRRGRLPRHPRPDGRPAAPHPCPHRPAQGSWRAC